jgi:hypothetical protein
MDHGETDVVAVIGLERSGQHPFAVPALVRRYVLDRDRSVGDDDMGSYTPSGPDPD